MATDLRRIPGVEPARPRPGGPRRDGPRQLLAAARLPGRRPPRLSPGRRRPQVSLTTALLAAGYLAMALYGFNALKNFLRVDIAVTGLRNNTVLTSTALAQTTFSFTVDPGDMVGRATLTVDGAPVAKEARQVEGNTIRWRPARMLEGRHEVALSVPRKGMGDSQVSRRFVVDDTPPVLEVPALLDPAPICGAVTVTGKVEPSASLTLDGAPLKHKNGSFTLRYDRPPAAPLQLVATDAAGNETTAEVIAPVLYPGGQGVHMTAISWAYEPLRRDVMALVDAGLVSAVQLDLKDEGGIVGYDSAVPLARQTGAVRPEYKLRETVAELKRKGVRVIGRVVLFRDAPLASWAWANGKRDWVVQTPDGSMLSTYGGFTNPASAEVQRYNLDIALEAIDAGVDDIMWDYVRRPEGDPASMIIPGLPGSSSNAVVEFLASSQALLRARCVYQGAAVFGIAADRPEAVGQDVPRMARHLDYMAPMLYPSHWVSGEYNVQNPNKQPYDIVKASLADFKEKIQGTGKYLVPWIQDFSYGYPYGPAEVRAQIDAAASLGVQDWLLWNASVVYTRGALSPSLVKLR